MTPATRTFAKFVAGWAAACVVLLLVFSGFFTSWKGQVVSVRDPDPELTSALVLVLAADGSTFEQAWPREAIDGLDLLVDARGLPPVEIPPDLASTRKEPFTLSFTIEPAGGGRRIVPTTGTGPLGVSLLIFLLGIALRNMLVAGSPLSLAAPEGRVTNHTAAPESPRRSEGSGGSGGGRRPRPKKGPPPGRPRRGGGRRR